MNLHSNCPDDPAETAEAYLMGNLQAAQASEFEGHLIGCVRCAAALEAAADFIEAMRRAARKLSEEDEH